MARSTTYSKFDENHFRLGWAKVSSRKCSSNDETILLNVPENLTCNTTKVKQYTDCDGDHDDNDNEDDGDDDPDDDDDERHLVCHLTG